MRKLSDNMVSMSLPLARYDEYWRLDTYKRTNNSDLRSLLEQQGSQVKSSASKTELVTLKHRLDCGLLYYNTCTDAELGKFVRERRINVGTSQKRGSVIQALIQADGKGIFRFLDLPPELRNNIYGYWLSTFDHALYLPS